MPFNNFEGGGSIFPTVVRPSLFNPLPPSELLTRKGEKFLWLRAMPTPDLQTGRLALPDENKGYIYTYEKTANVAGESTVLNATFGDTILTRFSPIARVNRVYIPKDPMLGTSEELKVKEFSGNKVTMEAGGLRYYDNVVINYDVFIFENQEREFELPDLLDWIPVPHTDRLAVKINSAWTKLPDKSRWKEAEISCSYIQFFLGKKYAPGTKVKINYDVCAPLDLAYKTITIKDIQESKMPAGAQEGDLEVLVSDAARLSKGDVLISTLSFSTEKEVSKFVPGKGYPLKRNPAAQAFEVLSKNKVYGIGDYSIQDKTYLVLNEKPADMPEYLSIAYTYNPAFRVAGSQEYSALSGKQQLRQYVLKPDTTNIILSMRTK